MDNKSKDRADAIKAAMDALSAAPPMIKVTLSGKTRKGKDEEGDFVELDNATCEIYATPVLARLAGMILDNDGIEAARLAQHETALSDIATVLTNIAEDLADLQKITGIKPAKNNSKDSAAPRQS